MLAELLLLIPAQAITWISGAGERLFPETLALCREHRGKLTYHDALMALACRELDIRLIVSLDGDFDGIAWLTRVFEPVSVSRLANNP